MMMMMMMGNGSKNLEMVSLRQSLSRAQGTMLKSRVSKWSSAMTDDV
jgi:hypothetical protein